MKLWLPPKLVRRVILWPIPVIGGILYLATVPLLLIAAFILSYRLPGRLRLVRAVGLFTVYLFTEAAVMVVGFVLWLASGFGWRLGSPRMITAHYAVMRWALSVLVGGGRRLYSLDIVKQVTVDDARDRDTSPMIVMARHAGPADSILLMNELMSGQGRRPRIVVKDVLQLDPAFDLLLNRLPNRFVPTKRRPDMPDTATLIGELASGMGDLDAFVIFPEGGNFTEARRVRAIDRLTEAGHQEAAERARRLRNVLPPRPAGTLAALESAPRADAVFVAHTGLDTIATPRDLWFDLSEHNVLLMDWYRVPASEIPATPAGRAALLLDAWDDIDAWVEQHRSTTRSARS